MVGVVGRIGASGDCLLVSWCHLVHCPGSSVATMWIGASGDCLLVSWCHLVDCPGSTIVGSSL